MYSSETKVRVRYSETDQMGFVYYGVFAQYFEIGRVELLRSLGISYKNWKKKVTFYQLLILKFIIKSQHFMMMNYPLKQL